MERCKRHNKRAHEQYSVLLAIDEPLCRECVELLKERVEPSPDDEGREGSTQPTSLAA